MEKKMHFEIGTVTECCLQMIDETLIEVLRPKIEGALLTKWNPRWGYRNVTTVNEGGLFTITVAGIARVHTRDTMKYAHVIATAKAFKARGYVSPISVEGNYADDRFRDTEYQFEKKNFPEGWGFR